jgi:hypothetical protein
MVLLNLMDGGPSHSGPKYSISGTKYSGMKLLSAFSPN